MRFALALLFSLAISPAFGQTILGRPMVPIAQGEYHLRAENERIKLVRLTSTEIPQPVLDACYSVGRVTIQHGAGASMGSSTYVGNGIWLTNRHVVESGGDASIKLKSGHVLPGRVTSISRSGPDLAVVETQDMDQWIRPIPISNDVPSPGMVVYPSGFDHGKMERHVCWPAKIVDFFQDGDLVSRGTGPREGSISGNSGGPTFTEKGELLAPLWGNSGGDTNAGTGTCITVNSFACRTYLLPWRERIMRSLTQCGPRGCQPPQQFSQPYGSQPYGAQPPSYQPQVIPSQPPAQPPNLQPPATQPLAGVAGPKGDTGPAGPKGDKGDPGEVTDAHLAKIIESVRKSLADDPNMRGRDGRDGERGERGEPGPKGDPGEITQQHIALIARALASDPNMRGPAGRDGKDVDIEVIVAEVMRRLPSTRVVLVDGQSKRVIDDETYKPGEAIVFDLNKLIRKTQ